MPGGAFFNKEIPTLASDELVESPRKLGREGYVVAARDVIGRVVGLRAEE